MGEERVVRVGPSALERIVSSALASGSQAALPYALIEFAGGRVVVEAVSDDRTLAAYAVYPADMVSKYNEIGGLLVETKKLLQVLKEHFKYEPELEFGYRVDEESGGLILLLRSENASYEEPMQDPEAPPWEKRLEDDKIVHEKDGYSYLKVDGVRVGYAYSMTVDTLRNVRKKWDELAFIAARDGLRMRISVGAGRVTKLVTRAVLTAKAEEPVTFSVDPGVLQLMGKVLSGRVALTVMLDEEGLPALLVFSTGAYGGRQTYLYTPVVLE